MVLDWISPDLEGGTGGLQSQADPDARSLYLSRDKYLVSVLSQSSSSSSFVLDHTVPYGTGSFGWRLSKHFVPGYDRTVPPGQFATGFSSMLVAKCLPARPGGDDTDRSLARSAWESVPRKNRPVGHGMIGYEGRPGRLSKALNTYLPWVSGNKRFALKGLEAHAIRSRGSEPIPGHTWWPLQGQFGWGKLPRVNPGLRHPD